MPDGAFGTCKFLNDVSLDELRAVLATHKAFVKERYGSGAGREAYVDAGDLGAEPEVYAQHKNAHPNASNVTNGANGHANAANGTADSLKRNGVKGDGVKEAAVKAGAVPVDGTGVLTNGITGTA